jgi:hypothetical protein
VCGPAATLLAPCQPINNPITVCGPSSGTILPGCHFNAMINAVPQGLDGTSPGEIDLTVGCGGNGVSHDSAVAAKASKGCNIDTDLNAWIDGERALLHDQAASAAQYYVAQSTIVAGKREWLTVSYPALQADARLNYLAFLRITGQAISDFPALTALERPIEQVVVQGPSALIDPIPNNPRVIFLPQWSAAFDEYNQRSGSTARPAPDTLPRAHMAAAARPLASAHFKLGPGQRRKLRLHLSRAQARSLVCSSAKAARAGFAVVRLIVAARGKPRPAVRFYDIRIRIKRHPRCK